MNSYKEAQHGDLGSREVLGSEGKDGEDEALKGTRELRQEEPGYTPSLG